jgi:hypothetical protein
MRCGIAANIGKPLERRLMSAFRGKADIANSSRHVRLFLDEPGRREAAGSH